MFSLLSGQQYKRVGGTTARGVEYHGPCPVCGGNDRFHIWPDHPKGPQWWCRQCPPGPPEGKGGDLIEFYRWRDGLSYRDACARAGVDARTYSPQAAPSSRRQSSPSAFVPVRGEQVQAIWAEHAAKFAQWCHEQLLVSETPREWLAARGIDEAMIAKYGLGWNPKDAYRVRESWGLPTVSRGDGKPKKLWLPLGLVIPQWIGEQCCRLRIRRPHTAPGQSKYFVVPGSGREPLISHREKSAYVVVESELDAVLLDGIVGDLVGVVAMGNASTKPTEDCHLVLAGAVHLSISLDSDPTRINKATGKTESPGAQGSLWWLNQYRQAERVPVIGGKDPGDAFKAGVDLRAWVMAGLPPRFHLASQQNMQRAAKAVVDNVTTEDHSSNDVEKAEAGINHRILTLQDGQEIHVVDSQPVWEQLVADGLIVFSENELQRLQTAIAGLEGEARTQAVQAAVDSKAVFHGAYIRRGEIMEHEQEQA